MSLGPKNRQQQKIPPKNVVHGFTHGRRRWPCWWPCPIPAPTWVSRWWLKTPKLKVRGGWFIHMGVFKNRGFPPKSSIFNGVFHYFHHPFWGPTPIFGNTHIELWKNIWNKLGIDIDIYYPFKMGNLILFIPWAYIYIFRSYIFVKKVTTISRDEVGGSF